MLTVISPAKNLDYDTPATTKTHSLPRFLDQSQQLIDVLSQRSVQDIAELMKLSDKLASLNVARYASWSQHFDETNAKQAVLAFNGDVYTGLEAETLTDTQLNYAQKSLRILSGLYGVLRPLDLMQPYRLEMGTKLQTSLGSNLYQFWGDTLTQSLNEELSTADQTNTQPILVNLASNEYFKAVQPKNLKADVITPVFKDCKSGQYKIISFYAKKARGLMARYIIENEIENAEDLKRFDSAGYKFSNEESAGNTLVFLRDEIEK